MNVFAYWEQDPRGLRYWYIDKCLELMKKKLAGCNFVLLCPENISDHLDMSVLPESWSSLPISKKADCIRSVALMQHGGLWLDADTVVMQCPSFLESSSVLYMQWTNQPRRILNGYIYCPRWHPVAEEWVSNIASAIRDNRTEWTALGEKCLTPAIDKCGGAEMIPLSTFLPVEVDREASRLTCKRTRWQNLISANTICFGLNHSWLSHKYSRDLRKPVFNSGGFLIHKLFREYVLREIDR